MKKPRNSYLLGLLLLAPIATSLAGGEAMGKPASESLGFKSVPDNHCQQRDHHGQLALLINLDPSRTIRYRLSRYYSNRRQPGIARGNIAPGEEVKLGCTRIHGREQVWKITRAEFLPTDTD